MHCYGFEFDDLVQFVGRHADRLRIEGKCTTGVVVPGIGEGDPRVIVELDLVEESFQGGGTQLALAAHNWPWIGVPIKLTPQGWKRRLDEMFRRQLAELLARPAHLQNPVLKSMLEQRLAQ